MKSVFEEASSLVKAIEKGWKKAGCPKKFSVTIYEMAQQNFFGFTKKKAKVGIFFEDRRRTSSPRSQDQRRRPYRSPRKPMSQSQPSQESPQQPSRTKVPSRPSASRDERSSGQGRGTGSSERSRYQSRPKKENS